MRIDKFYRDSIILTLSNLVTGIIGFIFSIVLSKNLGAEGLGLYGIIMPVYGLLLSLTSDGLVTAISKVSAVYYSRKDFRNLRRTMTTIFAFIFLWSLSIAFLVFINASNICTYIIKDPRVADAIRIVCPALLFVPMSAILKGYFYGMGKYKTPALIDSMEKLFRIIILLGTITILSLQEVRSTVTAAYFALSIGEFISFFLLYTFYRATRNKSKSGRSKPESRIQLLFNVLVISSPICLNSVISSIIATASTLALPRMLVFTGISYDSALALIGKFMGMAMNIVYLPFVIVGSLLTVLIPDLSLSISRNDSWATESRIAQVLKICYLLGISTLAVALTIPDSLGMLFYNRTDLGWMIRFSAICCSISYVSAPTFGILNGLGKQNLNLKNSLIVSVQGLILIVILTGIPGINIYGYGISMIITSLTALFMNLNAIRKYCDLRLPISEMATYTGIGVFSYLMLVFFDSLMPGSFLAVEVGLTTFLGFFLVFFLSRFV